ncbi:MAG TPA: autotransporter-associated beta strand repeat-containing protein [Phycisphaerae bacterium]|nr:autotransporter-associated beta strand repeat-containing protein [Phycisphaerae bacterium]
MLFRHVCRALLALLPAAAVISPSLAASTTWNAGTGLWNSANWSNGLPDASTDARIDNNTSINSVVTLSTNAAAASLVLDMNDTLVLGAGAGVTLTTTSIGNAGKIATGSLYASVSASGILVNNGILEATGGSTLFLDSQALVNNGLITADAPVSGNAAHIVLNHSNSFDGLSVSGAGNISIADSATLLLEHPVALSTTGWLDVTGQLQIAAPSSLSVGALHGDYSGSIFSTSSTLSTLFVTNGSASLAFAGTIGGNLSLVKTGANTLVLDGNNSYTGTTDVYDGCLQLDNPTLTTGGAGLGNLTVHATASLSGAGSTLCFTTIQSGAILSPGDWGPGNFTAANSLQLLANSTLLLDISNAAGSSDFLTITGGQFSADSVNVQFITHGALTPAKKYPLLNWTGASIPYPISAASFHLVNGSAHGFFTVDSNDSTLFFVETVPGDANQDGRIDLSDVSVVLNNFGKTTSLWTDGNFDGQPSIDLTDLSDVLNGFGTTVNPTVLPSTANTVPAPEPSSLLVLTPLLFFRRPRMRTR